MSALVSLALLAVVAARQPALRGQLSAALTSIAVLQTAGVFLHIDNPARAGAFHALILAGAFTGFMVTRRFAPDALSGSDWWNEHKVRGFLLTLPFVVLVLGAFAIPAS